MSNRILAAEYIIAIGFSSWAALKSKQLPWPPTVMRTSLAFGILYIVAQASPELAGALGAGFLLAQLIKVAENKPAYTGGTPNISKLPGDNDTGTLPGFESHKFGILGF